MALGDGQEQNSNTPVRVLLPAGKVAAKVACGEFHCVARMTDNTVYIWGDDSADPFQSPNPNRTPVEIALPAGYKAIDVSAYFRRSCIVLESLTDASVGAVWCRYAQIITWNLPP